MITLKPTGKTGVPANDDDAKNQLEVSYNSVSGSPQTIKFSFGLKKVELKAKDTGDFYFGATKKFELETEGEMSDKSDISLDKSEIVKLVDTKINPKEFSLEAIKPGTKKLTIKINKFRYTPGTEITVQKDKLTGIVLREDEQPIETNGHQRQNANIRDFYK